MILMKNTVLTEGKSAVLAAFNKILEYLPTLTACFMTFYRHILCTGFMNLLLLFMSKSSEY